MLYVSERWSNIQEFNKRFDLALVTLGDNQNRVVRLVSSAAGQVQVFGCAIAEMPESDSLDASGYFDFSCCRTQFCFRASSMAILAASKGSSTCCISSPSFQA